MSKRTPGSWKVSVTENAKFRGKDVTAYILEPPENSLPEAFERARLITAAPEMLALLKEALSEDTGEGFDGLVAAVIAKAEGRGE